MTTAGLDALLRNVRYEVIPARGTEQAVADFVPAGMTVTVTASPVRGLEPTIELAERLAARGYRVVPHLAARSVTGDTHLAEIVARLTACGVDDVFVAGGDAPHPAGPFDGALALLERLAEMGRPFSRIGITGYPESHPRIHDDVTIQAMWDKRRYASYIVSNVCFDAAALTRWIGRIRARGITLPLQVGLATPAERARLLRMAAVAGASESARFITRHPGWILRFWAPGGYSPDRLLDRAAAALTGPGSGVAGLHLFTLNQLQQAEQWRRAALRRTGSDYDTPGGITLMTDFAARASADASADASAVIIGAGIVGNSVAHHLARLGWRDLVLVDKGPMPNPGGSTGHASNFIFPIEYAKMMFELTADSTAQYQDLGVFTRSGGIEVARTAERMTELRRRCSQAKSWGIPAELISPAEVGKLVPYLDESVILGGAYFPTVGVVDSLRAGTLMREEAQRSGALTVLAGTEVLGITVDGGQVRSVTTSQGEIATGHVVICGGVWSPRIARMAGVRLALTPVVHQMISVGPIALFADTPGEISYPIVRDVDTNMYERQHGGDMEVGSYAHRPIIVAPDEIPSIEAAVLSPDRDAVHPGGLRPAAGPRARADARPARRRAGRHQVRDQRAHLHDPGRAPAAGRAARDPGAVVGGGQLDQGRTRLRPRGGRAHVRPGPHRRRARGRRRPVLPAPAHRGSRPGPRPRELQQDVRHRAPGRAVGIGAAGPGQPAL